MPTPTIESFVGRALSVAMPAAVDAALLRHLLRRDEQEDLVFALWTPSIGKRRASALLHTIVLPEAGDREVHGNVSFHPQYFERVLDLAARAGAGIAFLHSHLGPGWQGMSPDDVAAERRMAGAVASMTDLPLVGLTAGTDGTWSARMWFHRGARRYEPLWCESVRVAGTRLRVSFADQMVPPPAYREQFKRTQTVWGERAHQSLARLRVGIVGLGSVGMAIAELLARSGFARFVLIDFDEIQPHNLDRLQGAHNGRDVGRLKVVAARGLIRRSATAAKVEVREVPSSAVEDAGNGAALDCDVLFSCVDRPRARQILNHVAYAHLIPVVDGGIAVRFRDGAFAGAEWQAQTAGPDRPCLECLEMFTGEDADTERAGLLDDPSYMQGLPADHRLTRNENVYPFSTHLASLEMLQLIALAGGLAKVDTFGPQRFHFVAGLLESDPSRTCLPGCDSEAVIARGDSYFSFVGRDRAAEEARSRQARLGGGRFSHRWSGHEERYCLNA